MKMKRNALRHSFCSYRLALTQNANQTALEAGHSADILFKHYRQLCTEAEADAGSQSRLWNRRKLLSWQLFLRESRASRNS